MLEVKKDIPASCDLNLIFIGNLFLHDFTKKDKIGETLCTWLETGFKPKRKDPQVFLLLQKRERVAAFFLTFEDCRILHAFILEMWLIWGLDGTRLPLNLQPLRIFCSLQVDTSGLDFRYLWAKCSSFYDEVILTFLIWLRSHIPSNQCKGVCASKWRERST